MCASFHFLFVHNKTPSSWIPRWPFQLIAWYRCTGECPLVSRPAQKPRCTRTALVLSCHSVLRTVIKVSVVIVMNCRHRFELLTRICPLPGNCAIDSSRALISLSLTGLTRTTTLMLSSKGVELPDDFMPMSVESMLLMGENQKVKCLWIF